VERPGGKRDLQYLQRGQTTGEGYLKKVQEAEENYL
jgi:hypothetical protein